jgi:hypothetical protein
MLHTIKYVTCDIIIYDNNNNNIEGTPSEIAQRGNIINIISLSLSLSLYICMCVCVCVCVYVCVCVCVVCIAQPRTAG